MKVEEFRGASDVYVYIEAPTKEEAWKAANQYFTNYPTPGWGTELDFEKQKEEGVYLIRLSRYSSCD